jgi:serine phosphatase RsbU (regulator of sigma subunit)/anti-sigma regulatory factor (Ser/Thr protein kinase)
MIFLGELRVQAILENVRVISQFIYGIAQRLDLTEATLFYIDLAVEEAAVNIVHYAYPPGQPGDILLRVEMEDEMLHITLSDWGIPMDLAKVKPYDINAPVETRIKGGLGLHLINSVMDNVARQISTVPDGVNTITLIKHVQRLQHGAHRPSKSRELNAIRTVSQVMGTSIDIDNLLRLIVNKLVETLDADRGTLYLVDEEHNELVSRVLSEDNSVLKEIRVKIGEGIAGYVAATGQTVNTEDAYADPRHIQTFDKITGFRTRTILTIPMYNLHQKIIGVAQLLNKRGGHFTSRDERLLTVMASQAAISIENARLYEQELQQRLLNHELDTAHNIQASFLPLEIPQHAGWDITAFWLPARSVAGDFYDLYPLSDGRLGVVIADVSGKGIPAALFMALSVTVLRFAMGLSLTPGELMKRANQAILADQRSKMFATVFVGYLDPISGSLQFASAGHNPPLLYQAERGACKYLETSGVALGLFQDADYAQQQELLSPGDILVLYTDGITEVIDENEEEFGEKRLEELVIQNACRSAHEIINIIVEAITAFAVGNTIFDDETLVIIKHL